MKNTTHVERSVCQVTGQKRGVSYICSGFLCSNDGWILTAGHLFVEDGETFLNTSTIHRNATIKFPGSAEFTALLLYAEKRNIEGIDFAVLRLQQKPEGILPLPTNINDEVWKGTVHIAGISSYASDSSGAEGTIESNMVGFETGALTFLHIVAENAVKEGYSGGPIYSWEAGAVIGIQVMASSQGLHPSSSLIPIAERKTINAMRLSRMVEQFPALRDHLTILTRPFSGINILQLLFGYNKKKNIVENEHGYFDQQHIDEAILPLINQYEPQKAAARDLNRPILDAIRHAHNRNCFILGEEGGSGKTVTMLKLFSSWLNECQRMHTIKKIPIYIELRNVVTTDTGEDRGGRLFVEYLRDAFFLQGVFESAEELEANLYQELVSPSCPETHYVLLLDGLNEVPLSRRRIVCEEILFWAQKQHIQVIVTSRYKEELLVADNDQSVYSDNFEDPFEEQTYSETEKDFFLLSIQKLKDPVILRYLKNIGVQENIIKKTMANQRLLDILRIPMYLTIYARLYLTHLNRMSSNICTKGQLLGEFFNARKQQIKRADQKQIKQMDKIKPVYTAQRITEKQLKDIEKKYFIFDKIVPYIAFRLAVAQDHPLGIFANDLRELIGGLFNSKNSVMMKRDSEFRRSSFKENPYDGIRLFLQKAGTDNNNEDIYDLAEAVIRFIVQELHLMREVFVKRTSDVDNIGNAEMKAVMYEFLHENLRDFFAAKQLQADARYLGFLKNTSDISLASQNIPKPILEFLGDICEEHFFCPYWDAEHKGWIMSDSAQPNSQSFIANVLGYLRGKHDESSKIMVSNIIAVMKYARMNDLSGVDLHDLDFSNTWLGGIRFSRSYGNSYLTANFDGATIHASNLLRSGHNDAVTCVRQDMNNPNIVYSGDVSGCIMQWNLQSKKGQKICDLGTGIRDILVNSAIDELYFASEHTIYRFILSKKDVSTLYETRHFIHKLRLTNTGISFNTDINPVSWIELALNQEKIIYQIIGDVSSIPLWLTSCSYEANDGSWLVTGGTSKTHRVQVFEKKEDGLWNTVPAQIIPLPYGNQMNCIELSKDETRVLFCVQNNLYEYSISDRRLIGETLRLNGKEIRFACYLYDKTGTCSGILFSSGRDIILLDKNYQECLRLNGGDGICKFVEPILIEREPYLKEGKYTFTNHSGIQRKVYEKYHLHVNQEIQEFDADTNICSRVFSIHNRVKLGYFLKDRELRLFNRDLTSFSLKCSQWETQQYENYQFVDYGEMKGTTGFRVQLFGQQVIVYDRYTSESDTFNFYEGLLIQRCSMKKLQGDMAEFEHQAILKRYGAILEEETI